MFEERKDSLLCVHVSSNAFRVFPLLSRVVFPSSLAFFRVEIEVSLSWRQNEERFVLKQGRVYISS